ncbi:MAG: YbaK/EbsC family protein [Steroidobacteraceae bacterium]|jgi:Ala-tRNA(Pro) deacylase|nr:YbaK/EbsC family protein [Steroidobacteraceae bacterium]
MSVAPTVIQALRFRGVEYTIVEHPHTATAVGTAHAARVAASHVAKAVLLKDSGGYVLAVLPASEDLDLDRVARDLHRPMVLATEADVAEAFFDCEPGAVPAVGEDYLIPTIVDASLREAGDVYFEAGDHARLVHLTSAAFRSLMEDAEYLPITRRRAQ